MLAWCRLSALLLHLDMSMSVYLSVCLRMKMKDGDLKQGQLAYTRHNLLPINGEWMNNLKGRLDSDSAEMLSNLPLRLSVCLPVCLSVYLSENENEGWRAQTATTGLYMYMSQSVAY